MGSNLHPIIENIFESFGMPRNNVSWADGRLLAAYLLVEEAAARWNNPEDCGPGEALKRVLDELETADCEIGECSRPYVSLRAHPQSES